MIISCRFILGLFNHNSIRGVISVAKILKFDPWILLYITLPGIFCFVIVEILSPCSGRVLNRDSGNIDLSSNLIMPLAIIMLLVMAVCALVHREYDIRDPWDDLLEEDFWEKATPLYFCGNCGALFDDRRYFCESCGSSVGYYNNSMPFLWIFSLGDLLMYCISPGFRGGRMNIAGVYLMALGQYGPLAIFYLYRMHKQIKQNRQTRPVIQKSRSILDKFLGV